MALKEERVSPQFCQGSVEAAKELALSENSSIAFASLLQSRHTDMMNSLASRLPAEMVDSMQIRVFPNVISLTS